MKKTYQGSCHCRRITFEADIDFSQPTGKCNCTYCWKHRWWAIQIPPGDFRLLSGAEELTYYPKKSAEPGGPGGFCKHCGVTPFLYVDPAEWNDGAKVSVGVASLDDLDPKELVQGPVVYCDGRSDNWWHPPAETRHL